MDRSAEAAVTPAGCRRSNRRLATNLPFGEHAKVFKALGDETRLKMVLLIAEAGELCSCELEEHFELTQPTISHHLKLLREAGVIEGERRGTWIHYQIVPGVLRAATEHEAFQR